MLKAYQTLLDKLYWTAEELGVSPIVEDGAITEKAMKALAEKLVGRTV